MKLFFCYTADRRNQNDFEKRSQDLGTVKEIAGNVPMSWKLSKFLGREFTSVGKVQKKYFWQFSTLGMYKKKELEGSHVMKTDKKNIFNTSQYLGWGKNIWGVSRQETFYVKIV